MMSRFARFARFVRRNRWRLISLAIIVPLGFLTKIYSGPASDWVQNSLGGVLYVIFWSLLFSIPFSSSASWKIALIVLVATCSLEILQLWHPPFLEQIRSTFLGHALMGNSFSWKDLVHYFAGFLLSLVLLSLLRNKRLFYS